MAVGEVANLIGDHTVSSEAVSRVRLALSGHFDELVEVGIRPYQKNSKLSIGTSVPVSAEADLFSSEWDEAYERQVEEGGIDSLTITRDMKTAAVSSASIHGTLPARLTREEAFGLYRADTWHARLQFPPKHDPDEEQRLVVDTWQTPWTHASVAAKALSTAPRTKKREASYYELHKNMTERDESGLPIGAVAIQHTVHGAKLRPLYLPEQAARLNAVMGSFSEAVHLELAWQKNMDAELARERQ